jgi:hypothetical protein
LSSTFAGVDAVSDAAQLDAAAAAEHGDTAPADLPCPEQPARQMVELGGKLYPLPQQLDERLQVGAKLGAGAFGKVFLCVIRPCSVMLGMQLPLTRSRSTCMA